MEVLDKDGLEYYNDLIDKKFLKRTGGKVTGHVSGVTAPSGDNSTKFATTAFVQNAKTQAESEANAYTDTGVASANAYTDTGVASAKAYTDTGVASAKVYTDEQIRQHANLPVGFEYFSMNPKVPQGSLPLFGGEYSRTTYADLWAWVQEQSGYLKTEAEWQTLSAANNGNVPYYSKGDGSTTFRVPSLRCWVKGANGNVTEVGSYLAAGLPNITGHSSTNIYTSNASSGELSVGSFTISAPNTSIIGMEIGNTKSARSLSLDASKSSSIYGKSSTVQPESIVGMWLVKAWGTVEETGTINEQQYIDDRIAALPVSLASTFLPLAGGEMSGAIAINDRYGADGKPLPFIYNPSESGGLVISGGRTTNLTSGRLALLSLNASANYTSIPTLKGGFALSSTDGINTYILTGHNDGKLKWNDKSISINAAGLDYIRYDNGVQICWGMAAENGGIPQTVTYPVPFSDLPSIGISNGDFTTISWQKTGFSLGMSAGATKPSIVYFKYIAIGHWE